MKNYKLRIDFHNYQVSSYITNHNGFTFYYDSLENLWFIDACISLKKDTILIKLVRAATLWVVWLIRNKVCLNNSPIPSLASIGTAIIVLTSYCCKVKHNDTFFKLTLIQSMDVSFLTLVDRGSCHLIYEEDPRLEEESNMSDYFSYLDDIAALDAAIIPFFLFWLFWFCVCCFFLWLLELIVLHVMTKTVFWFVVFCFVFCKH